MSEAAPAYRSLLDDVVCNLCGSADHDIVYPPRYELADTERIVESFRSSGDEVLLDQLVRCRECGLQYLTPRLRQDIVLEGYSEGTDETFVSQAGARERTFDKALARIERLRSGKGRILDVGTAGGSFLGVARKRGWETAGCEPNRWLAAFAKERYGVDVVPGTVFDMDLADASFDVVTLWDVLEHTPDPKAVLLECRRVLKPDGLLIVNYPDIASSVARAMGRRWVFLLSVHLYYFTPRTIGRMLAETGFRPRLRRKHWQTLELGYIFQRMQPYVGGLARLGERVVRAIGLGHANVPYWMGQELIVAEPAGGSARG